MRARRGFTMVELAATLAAAGLLGGAALTAGQPESLRSARQSARQLKDSTQIRGIHQAMVIWAQQNKDVYPLPSAVDSANKTVQEQGQEKDTTANVMSLMVFNGSLSTEIFVSPVEKNPAVEVDEDYEFDQPRGSVEPAMVMWDPKFSAELGPKKGNISYANLQPFGPRLERWANTFGAEEVVLTTRGPEIKAVEKNGDGTVSPKLANADSVALRLYGGGKSWSGHAAFNDNHVDFATDKMADGRPMGANEPAYRAKDGKEWPDIRCYDEPDEEAASNNYLGLFLKAGKERSAWKGAWD